MAPDLPGHSLAFVPHNLRALHKAPWYPAAVVVGPVNLSGSAGELRGCNLLFSLVTSLWIRAIALMCTGAISAVAAISPDPLTPEERAWLTANQPLRYAPQPYNAPYEVQVSNSVAGITPTLLGVIATNLGFEFTNVFITGSANEAVLLGRADFTGAYAATATRREVLEFSEPYLWASNAFYVRAGSGISSFNDLKNRRVGVVHGRSAQEWLEQQSIPVRIVSVGTGREGMLLLSAGQLDAMFETEWAAQRVIFGNTLLNVRRLPGSPFGTPQQFATAKTNAILARILQKGLETIPLQQKAHIIEAWRPVGNIDTSAPLPRWFWEALAAAGIVALGLLLWNLELRREVARRTFALKESEEHFRVLYENAPVAYHSMDAGGQLLEVNSAWLELLGYTRQEVAGRSVMDFLDPSSAPLFKDILARLQQKQRLSGVELRFRCKRGEELVFSVEARADARDGGRIQRAHCVLHNITERQRAAAAVHQTQARLSAAQRIARLGTWEMALRQPELAQNEMWWSDEVYRMLGYSTGETSASFELFIRHLPTAERGTFNDNIQRGLADRRSCEFDHRVVRTDGTERFAHQHVEVLCDTAGTPIRLAGTIQDITERKQAEEQIRTLNARLEGRLVALTQPLGDLSGVRFQDLFDLEEIQRIQDAFASAAGVASIITDVDGRPITRPSNFCRLCEHIIRKTEKGFENCCHSDAVIGRKNDDGPVMQRCLSGGLWDAGSSICVGDRHVANWLIGQVLDSSADEQSMLDYARLIGANEQEFQPALTEVNRMPLEQFEKITVALHIIARQLSRQAVQNVQQARFITEKKRVQSELEEKQRFITAVAGNTPDYIVVFDLKEQRQVYTNRSLSELLGYTEEEVRTFAPNELLHVLHPEDAPRFFQHVRGLENADSGVRSFEFRVRRRDGTYAWFLSRDVVFERDPDGNPRKVLSVAQDITERKDAEEKRAQLEAQLRQSQKMEAVGQLAGGVAHDFNNILAAMLMNIDLLREAEALDEMRTGMRDLEALARRAATLTSQLLQFGRRQVLQRRSLDINALLLGLAKLLERVIGEHITLECKVGNGPLWVEADSGMIEQVVTNLVVNARDAMPKGGRIVLSIDPVVVDARHVTQNPKARAGSFVRLKVKDEGCGMDAHTMCRIFEPFFTTKDVGKGTGLGLSTVYGVVEQHQGWVEVESEVGKGSSFRVYLPRGETPADDGQAPATQGASVRRGHETVLVVEDEPAVRRLVARTLTSQGYSVFEAGHGQEALQCWERQDGKVDVLLSDVVMPEGLGGFELAKRLRSAKPELRVILMSGYNAEMMSDGFEVPPGTAFLQKPFTPDVLIRALRGVLDRAANSGSQVVTEKPGGR